MWTSLLSTLSPRFVLHPDTLTHVIWPMPIWQQVNVHLVKWCWNSLVIAVVCTSIWSAGELIKRTFFGCHICSSKWCVADTNTRENMRSCGSQCSKKVFRSIKWSAAVPFILFMQLDCGHRCPQSCHPGPCNLGGQCQKKLTVRCPCRRLKKV